MGRYFFSPPFLLHANLEMGFFFSGSKVSKVFFQAPWRSSRFPRRPQVGGYKVNNQTPTTATKVKERKKRGKKQMK